VDWKTDDRGSVDPESLKITPAEIRRKGWDGRRSDRVPPIWREAVRKALAQREARIEKLELALRLSPPPATSPDHPPHQFPWQSRS